MNFIELESSQKLRGGFYTDPMIAAYLVRWIEARNPEFILEPSCGDGVFLDMIEQREIHSLKRVIACEVEPDEAEKSRKRTSLPIDVHNCDFLHWFLFKAHNQYRFDAIVGNPPFIRYQYLNEEQQFLAEKIFSQLGLPFTKHTNAWVPFVLASIKLLKPGGRIAMVIPSEIFHIPHAASLRQYLITQCSRVLILDPQEIWFGDTLQGTVLLLAEKKYAVSEKSKGVSAIPISNRQTLSEDPEYLFQHAIYINDETIDGKWMQIFLTHAEREIITRLRTSPKIVKFSKIASVDVGIVTGANKFFLVTDDTVNKFNLHQWVYPMFGRSEHVEGLIFSTDDHQTNKIAGLPSNFLWFQDENIENMPDNVRRYLELGIDQQIHKRFKCRTRKCWYKVPSVYSAPIAMLKRAHNYPRLILNRADAFTTDTAYRIQPINIEPTALVLGFVNSLTCLTAELEGRHYGGGVLELVPSEIERLLIPLIDTTIPDFEATDRRFRETKDQVAFLQKQDAFILGSINITRQEQETIHNAWLRLRDRRHRLPSPNSTTDQQET